MSSSADAHASSSSSAAAAATTAGDAPAPGPDVVDASEATLLRDMVYACRRCRSSLFRPSLIQEHEIGKHGFSAHKMQKESTQKGSGGAGGAGGGGLGGWVGGGGSSDECTSFFLQEALQWMKSASEDVEGKLCCYACGARVGVLKWAGSQCSCGTWVTPAIQLYKKTLDLRQQQAGQQVGQPGPQQAQQSATTTATAAASGGSSSAAAVIAAGASGAGRPVGPAWVTQPRPRVVSPRVLSSGQGGGGEGSENKT